MRSSSSPSVPELLPGFRRRACDTRDRRPLF